MRHPFDVIFGLLAGIINVLWFERLKLVRRDRTVL